MTYYDPSALDYFGVQRRPQMSESDQALMNRMEEQKQAEAYRAVMGFQRYLDEECERFVKRRGGQSLTRAEEKALRAGLTLQKQAGRPLDADAALRDKFAEAGRKPYDFNNMQDLNAWMTERYAEKQEALQTGEADKPAGDELEEREFDLNDPDQAAAYEAAMASGEWEDAPEGGEE